MSGTHIQMEITLRCNAKCLSCSRHCHYGMYDGSSDVTYEQVERFCSEIRLHGKERNVGLISIMGGEPTLHPDLHRITTLIARLHDEGHTRLAQIVTNGKISPPSVPGVMICTVEEDADIRYENHRCQFVSPFDTGQVTRECPIIEQCGVSWGAYGWWPCGAGGAICRLMGLEQFRSDTMPERLLDQSEALPFCIHCQCKASRFMYCRNHGDIRSVSFRKAIDVFDAKKLWRY